MTTETRVMKASNPLSSGLELGLWLVAIVCLGWVASTWLDARLFHVQAKNMVTQTSAISAIHADAPNAIVSAEAAQSPGSSDGAAPALATERTESGSQVALASTAAVAPAAIGALENVIGMIEIPRLGLEAPIATGTDEKTLDRAVGHIDGTSMPGPTGNVGLAGHRDSYFRALKDIALNDYIVIRTPGETHRYRVIWKQVVEPTEIPVLYPTDEAALTLVTCYPFCYVGPAPQRFIVRALRVG